MSSIFRDPRIRAVPQTCWIGPAPEPTPRDFRDALHDARDMAKDACCLYRDDPAIEREARLQHIEAAFNCLIEARMLLEEGR